MRTHRKLVLLFTACAIGAPGCSALSQKPVTPAVSLPTQYRSEGRESADGVPSAARWWQGLGDPQLDALVERALAGNPDLDIAVARIAAARSRLREADSATRPQAELGASANREQLSANGQFGAAARSGFFPPLHDSYRVGLDVSWEWDLFGANEAQRERARAGIAAAEAEREALQLSIPAEVATVYVEHLVAAQQSQALGRSIASGERRVVLLAAQRAQGDIGDAELIAARMQLERAKAQLPRVRARCETLRHAMGALLGSGEYVVLPESGALLDRATALIDTAWPVGAPSDLLRRRPDLRAAEARYREAFAERQYAIADQYPRFVLSGSVGHEALRSGDLLESASLAWSLVRQLTLPVLDGGRRSAERDYRQARLEAAIAGYRADVVTALVDVEQTLLARNAATAALRAEEARLADAHRSLELERSRLRFGDTASVHVSAAEQSYEQVLADVLDARGEALSSLVRLQKALGGPA